jgi:hypothetical protein
MSSDRFLLYFEGTQDMWHLEGIRIWSRRCHYYSIVIHYCCHGSDCPVRQNLCCAIDMKSHGCARDKNADTSLPRVQVLCGTSWSGFVLLCNSSLLVGRGSMSDGMMVSDFQAKLTLSKVPVCTMSPVVYIKSNQ